MSPPPCSSTATVLSLQVGRRGALQEQPPGDRTQVRRDTEAVSDASRGSRELLVSAAGEHEDRAAACGETRLDIGQCVADHQRSGEVYAEPARQID
jgi:hypothetical protein